MLKRYKYFVFAIMMTSVIACQKKLDIEPTQSIDESKALVTSSDVEAALIGAYSDLGDGDVYGGGMAVISELLANTNEFNWTGTYQGLTQINNKQIPVDNGFVESTWLDAYQAINDVNNVLNALDVVADSKKDKVEGEAKFIRGSLYFDLVRLYAKAWNDGNPAVNLGVPIVLTPTRAPLTEADKRARNTVAEVYAQAIKDLTDAESLLPKPPPPPTPKTVYANKYTAAAMLARVYLQKGDYANALAAANRVIESNEFVIEPSYTAVFPYNAENPNDDQLPDPREYIFSMQVSSSQGTNELNTYFSTSGRGDIDINNTHLNLYEAGDERLNLFYDDGGTRTGKFDMIYGNVPVIRLAEMYLIRAESNFRLGSAVGATPVSDINRIRNRAGLASYTAGELTLAKILKERKLELAFEGHAIHDIKRLQGSVGVLPWNSPRLILPIPDREIKINSNLVQNER